MGDFTPLIILGVLFLLKIIGSFAEKSKEGQATRPRQPEPVVETDEDPLERLRRILEGQQAPAPSRPAPAPRPVPRPPPRPKRPQPIAKRSSPEARRP